MCVVSLTGTPQHRVYVTREGETVVMCTKFGLDLMYVVDTPQLTVVSRPISLQFHRRSSYHAGLLDGQDTTVKSTDDLDMSHGRT